MPMGYEVQFSGVTVSAAQDIFEILCPADAVIEIIGASFTDDTAETSEEAVVTGVKGIGATSGSGGSSPTITKMETGFAASGATVEANNTTAMTAGGGSVTTQRAYGFNYLNGWVWNPTPRETIWLSPSERYTFHIPAPGASRTCSGTLRWLEYGG